jgi:Fic family protein
MTWQLTFLPLAIELETKAVLKQVALAHRYLAELKGIAATIPNEQILINTLILQEARDSSVVENIITTQISFFKRNYKPV